MRYPLSTGARIPYAVAVAAAVRRDLLIYFGCCSSCSCSRFAEFIYLQQFDFIYPTVYPSIHIRPYIRYPRAWSVPLMRARANRNYPLRYPHARAISDTIRYSNLYCNLFVNSCCICKFVCNWYLLAVIYAVFWISCYLPICNLFCCCCMLMPQRCCSRYSIAIFDVFVVCELFVAI